MKYHSILLLFFMTGCTTSGYFETRQLVDTNPTLTELIASEICGTIKNSFPPAKTTILFEHGTEALSIRLENDLRTLGYAVSGKKSRTVPAQLPIAYTLDRLSGDTTILRVVAGDTFQATRAYRKSSDGSYTGIGPLLIRRTPE